MQLRGQECVKNFGRATGSEETSSKT